MGVPGTSVSSRIHDLLGQFPGNVLSHAVPLFAHVFTVIASRYLMGAVTFYRLLQRFLWPPQTNSMAWHLTADKLGKGLFAIFYPEFSPLVWTHPY